MMDIRTMTIATCLLLVTLTTFGQQDTENIDKARTALDVTHKCDEAMRFLNLVSPGNRLSPDYILCMGKTQDCMQNNEQALYYYNKYLALKPDDDSVKRRAAELNDQKNRMARVSGEERKAKDLYQTVSKNRKKRKMILTDNYISTGIGYGFGLSADNSPFKRMLCFEGSSGFLIIHNQAVIDINSMSAFLLAQNTAWFTNVSPLPPGSMTGFDAGPGFSEGLTVGFSPVLVNKKDMALSVGAMGGFNYYLFPSSSIDYYTTISNKIIACYGIKSNLYLGEHVMFFMNLLLHASKTAGVSTSYSTSGMSDYNVPANYNMLNVGIAIKFDSWW